MRTGEHVGERQRSWLPPDHSTYKAPHWVLSFPEGIGVARILGVGLKLKPVKNQTAGFRHARLHHSGLRL